MTDNIVEKLARAIADQLGDGFDNAHRNKPHWAETRGESGGRFRDINEPRQNDYLDAARAAIAALREPSEAMIEAGHTAPHLSTIARHRMKAGWQRMIDRLIASLSTEGNEG